MMSDAERVGWIVTHVTFSYLVTHTNSRLASVRGKHHEPKIAMICAANDASVKESFCDVFQSPEGMME